MRSTPTRENVRFLGGLTNNMLRSKLIAKLVGGRVNLVVRAKKETIF